MQKKINIVFLCIILMLCGCQTLTYKIKDNKKELSPKEQILSAFSFWVNKENWLYDNSVYVDVQKNIKIYYKARNEAEYLGYIFIANGDKYDKIVFVINKNDGYQSEPLYVKQVKTIDGKLSYLGEKKFFFSKKSVRKPQFPVSSERKEHFIKRAKRNISNILAKNTSRKKINYEVYILNFTNADSSAGVIIIEDGKKMWLSEVVSEIEGDDGKIKKNLAEFRGQRGPTIDWTNAENREEFRKELEMSICKFSVKIQ